MTARTDPRTELREHLITTPVRHRLQLVQLRRPRSSQPPLSLLGKAMIQFEAIDGLRGQIPHRACGMPGRCRAAKTACPGLEMLERCLPELDLIFKVGDLPLWGVSRGCDCIWKGFGEVGSLIEQDFTIRRDIQGHTSHRPPWSQHCHRLGNQRRLKNFWNNGKSAVRHHRLQPVNSSHRIQPEIPQLAVGKHRHAHPCPAHADACAGSVATAKATRLELGDKLIRKRAEAGERRCASLVTKI